MHTLDWFILICFAVVISAIAYSARKYNKSVAAFLAANRCAGKYLLAMGDGMANTGAISLIAGFQLYYEGGFTAFWWQSIMLPLSIFVAITGWVIYRFRQTRAMTMAQFFEMRYNKKVRVLAGVLAFLSGVINFGIFPSVGASFFMYFCDLPQSITLIGLNISVYPLIMATLITIALMFIWVGGQIAVIITDFIQGVFCNVVFIIVLLVLFAKFDWSHISSVLSQVPENHSMTNPFDISGLKNYNTFYYLISFFSVFYCAYSWQGAAAYNCSAENAHEARMSKILGYLRYLTPILFMIMLPLCAFTFFNHSDFVSEATQAQAKLSSIENLQVRTQMTAPVAMNVILPLGVVGLLSAVMFAAFVGNHNTYLHSWGSIFLQDIVMPLRKKPFKPSTHIWLLRLSTLGVAVAIFLFSLWFKQSEDILMFFALSGTIFLAGSGAVVIGGLYWKKGTSAGAISAFGIGLIMAIFGFAFSQSYWPGVAGFIQSNIPALWSFVKGITPSLNDKTFLFNPQEWFFFSTIICTAVYVVISLLTGKEAYNMDRMLHKGKYRIEGEDMPEELSTVSRWRSVLGLTGKLRLDDKFIIYGSYSYMIISLIIVLGGTVYNLVFGIPDGFWLVFWRCYIWLFLAVTVVLTLWLGIGGFIDLRRLYKVLGTVKADDRDNGTVVEEHNLADVPRQVIPEDQKKLTIKG